MKILSLLSMVLICVIVTIQCSDRSSRKGLLEETPIGTTETEFLSILQRKGKHLSTQRDKQRPDCMRAVLVVKQFSFLLFTRLAAYEFDCNGRLADVALYTETNSF